MDSDTSVMAGGPEGQGDDLLKDTASLSTHQNTTSHPSLSRINTYLVHDKISEVSKKKVRKKLRTQLQRDRLLTGTH